MHAPVRSLLISLLLHAAGAAAAMVWCVPVDARADWRGEEASVRCTITISSRPSLLSWQEPMAEEPPRVEFVPPTATAPAEPVPPTEDTDQRHEIAPVPAVDVTGSLGELANVEPPEEPSEPPLEPAPPTPAPEVAEPATPVADPVPVAKHEDVVPPAAVPPSSAAARDSMHVDPSPVPGCNPTPPYPFVAWRRRIQGTVVLSLRIGVDGAVVEAQVARSSGNPSLDDSALRTLKTWKFTPARDAFGPHETTFEKEVVFRISG